MYCSTYRQASRSSMRAWSLKSTHSTAALRIQIAPLPIAIDQPNGTFHCKQTNKTKWTKAKQSFLCDNKTRKKALSLQKVRCGQDDVAIWIRSAWNSHNIWTKLLLLLIYTWYNILHIYTQIRSKFRFQTKINKNIITILCLYENEKKIKESKIIQEYKPVYKSWSQ